MEFSQINYNKIWNFLWQFVEIKELKYLLSRFFGKNFVKVTDLLKER